MAESVGIGEDCLQQALAYAAQKLRLERLNEKQAEAVTAFIGGKDVFVSLPTGYGKSVCFQSVPFVLDYIGGGTDKCIAIIVEPTAAVMRDQVLALKSKGISAEFINHEQTDNAAKQAVVQGKVKFVYISPESLSLSRYREMLYTESYQKNLSIYAVDEVHCMLTWANFRKHFKCLSEIRAIVNVNVMALTATCRESDRLNIMTDLCMNEAAHVQCNADRPNIFLEVRVMPGNIEQWSPILEDDVKVLRTFGVKSDRKVFFCRSIEMACRLYEYYEEALGKFVYCNPSGCPIPSNRIVAMYHSESATSVKNAVSTSLSDPSGVVRRVFATQSLSMGIHCLNVREVIHWGIPRTLEQYFQECGRAGRDGLPAKATLLHTRGQLCEKFCSKPVIDYCNSNVCYRRMLLTYFNVSEYDQSTLPNAIACCSLCSAKSCQ